MHTKVAGRIDQTRLLERRRRHLRNRGSGAFTFVDLVATLALISLIAVMVVPTLGRAGSNGAAVRCLNNLRQLGAAWAMYSSDSQGMLIESHPNMMVGGSRVSGTANPYSWAPGNAGSVGGPANAYGPLPLHSSTNPIGLTKTVFYKYYNDIDLLKCASDKRSVNGNPILRSYSMNNWMNGGSTTVGYQLFTNQTQVLRPASIWVMMDEDELTLDDSYFYTSMDSQRPFINVPGRRHNNGYALNFADGHSEIYKFRDPVMMNLKTAPGGAGVAGAATSVDFRFHTNATTYPIAWEN